MLARYSIFAAESAGPYFDRSSRESARFALEWLRQRAGPLEEQRTLPSVSRFEGLLSIDVS